MKAIVFPLKAACTAAALTLVLVGIPAYAGARSSANYIISTDTVDASGRRATSASYTNDSDTGELAGVSNGGSAPAILKGGYIGQLYEITGLVIDTASPKVPETGTLQLAAWQSLDDASLLAVPAASVAWSVTGGPVTGISAAGVATAGVVYQDTPATVQGSLGGFAGSCLITVLDTIPDNFGSYAGDGIGDDWQVAYFGVNNPNAGPNVDFDGTGQTNLFKYIAGLNPLDPHSRFSLVIAPVHGQPTWKNLIFSPVVAGRTYTVTSKTTIPAATWAPIPASAPTDDDTQRTVTASAATGTTKYYRIEITKP